MITTDKVTEIFCILDEFCKNLDAELTKNLHIAPIDEGYKRMRNCKVYVVKQKCTTWAPIKFGGLVRIINKKVYLHNDNKKELFSKS